METNNKRLVPYKPVHPGEILREELNARGIKQKDFAQQIGMQPSHLNEFLKGKRNVTEKLAMLLEEHLGIPFYLWMKLQSDFYYDSKVIAERKVAETELAMEEWTKSVKENLAKRSQRSTSSTTV